MTSGEISGSARPARTLAAIGLAAGLVIGAVLGAQGAIIASRGGLEGLGAVVFYGLAAGLVVLLGVVGVIAFVSGGSRRLAMGSLAATAGVIVGAVGGAMTIPALDLGYHAPVVRTLSGTASLRLDAAPGFTPNDDGPVNCRSAPDGLAVEQVTALDLGELDDGTLRMFVWPPDGQLDGIGRLEIFVDGADIPAGAPMPAWSAPGTFETDANGQRGSATFVATTGGPVATGWPVTIAGSVTWTCQEWAVGRGASPAAHIAAARSGALDTASVPNTTASPRPPTCAERFPADGPAGVDLQLGCVVNEVVGSYLGLGGPGGAAPRLSGYLMPILLLASALAFVGLLARRARRSAGRRLAAAAPTAWWSCPTCRSLNAAGRETCYRCGRLFEAGTLELRTDGEPLAPQSFGRRSDRP